jgi:hypothetical protein
MTVHTHIIKTVGALHTAYTHLRWYARIFFPAVLAEKLETVDPAKMTAVAVFEICQAYEQAKQGWFFRFFVCLITFGQSDIVGTFTQLHMPTSNPNPSPMTYSKMRTVFAAATAHEDPHLYLCNSLPSYFEMTAKQQARQRVMQEKKGKLTGKIDMLIALVSKEITLLEPICRSYRNFLTRQHALKSELHHHEQIRDHATKLQHYDTGYYSFSAPYSCYFYYSHMSDFAYLATPTVTYRDVPDYEKRREAGGRCRKLYDRLYRMEEAQPSCPEEYDRSSQMSHFVQELKKLKTRMTDAQESELDNLLENYKRILNQVTPFFLDRSTFSRKEYLPVSEYAELKIQEITLEKLLFFRELPGELKGHIAGMVVGPDFPEQDRNFCY